MCLRNRILAALFTFVFLCFLRTQMTVQAGAIKPDPVASEIDPHCRSRPIDLVICLDTSGSMEGLIDSARARLWDIVNSLAKARPLPQLRVGLITYGSPSRSNAANGWLVKQTDLTTDLDTVYAKMMSLRTDGGDEFVGWALRRALDWMEWSNDPQALKLVFIAGNESADQASEVFNFRYVAEEARNRGITVNSIYCGDREMGVRERWDQVAACGGGSYSAIDMRCGTIQIETPHDKVLLELNLKLNATYVPYGSLGQAGRERQLDQDRNADRVGIASSASRAEAKATALYDNSQWDLVDGVKNKRVAVKDLKESDLPAAMQGKPVEEREQFVETQARARADIQRRIAEVSLAREQFLRDARAQSAGGKQALDEAMIDALRIQAKAKGFKFD